MLTFSILAMLYVAILTIVILTMTILTMALTPGHVQFSLRATTYSTSHSVHQARAWPTRATTTLLTTHTNTYYTSHLCVCQTRA